MVSFKGLIVLAFAGLALAAPVAKDCDGNTPPSGVKHFRHHHHTASSPAAAPEPTGSVQTLTVVPVEASTPEAATSNTGSDTTTSSGTPTADSTDTNYIDIVNKWRTAGGLPTLTQNSQLQANALKTVTDDNGKMSHELNPGSMAQVLSEGGNANNFEHTYVHMWLCEIPTLPGLDGVCSTNNKEKRGETGHAEILTSKSYTAIGCALFNGIWGCDLH